MSAYLDPIASFSGPLTDPLGSSPLIAAVAWLQNTLLGTIATTVAVVAVASVGFMMLSGRLNLRVGATVVVGCFVLFGASSIAEGIQFAAQNAGGSQSYEAQAEVAPSPSVALPPKPNPNYDPYAGASVPRRR